MDFQSTTLMHAFMNFQTPDSHFPAHFLGASGGTSSSRAAECSFSRAARTRSPAGSSSPRQSQRGHRSSHFHRLRGEDRLRPRTSPRASGGGARGGGRRVSGASRGRQRTLRGGARPASGKFPRPDHQRVARQHAHFERAVPGPPQANRHSRILSHICGDTRRSYWSGGVPSVAPKTPTPRARIQSLESKAWSPGHRALSTLALKP